MVFRRREAAELLFHLVRALLEDLSHHHARARGDCRPAVGNARRIGLRNLHVLVGMPSASDTICACVVRVPWPISVLPTAMRTPVGVSTSRAST